MINKSELFHTLYQKTRHMTKELNEQLQQHQLYSSQWSILYCLKKNGPMTQSEMWRYLGVEAPTVTRTLLKLEDAGWISRKHGKDKRERLVFLTSKAENHLPTVEKSVTNFEEQMLQNLTEEEQEYLLSLLNKLGN
ncbi:MarR family transcriptional regulator [Metabacillus litoralis]|uniref:MarR family transcriptional regulator n=1 Tax=Metabacillus litoralis TaxID=152268 RepID=A0A5C6VW75_9BACI|nr:MarR family transcriptional regulator [Metabacillus litoralis]TXC89487.1 MarR family transcriptional regulator [Metabacillus litoralis]